MPEVWAADLHQESVGKSASVAFVKLEHLSKESYLQILQSPYVYVYMTNIVFGLTRFSFQNLLL